MRLISHIKRDLEVNKCARINTKIWLCLYRSMHHLYQNGGGVALVFLRIVNKVLFWNSSNDISYRCKIGGSLRVPHFLGIVISEYAVIGDGCTIFQNVTIGVNEHANGRKAPNIGNHVYIGANAVLLGSINVGDNCVIGAGAIVTHDVPDGSVVVGINNIRSSPY